MEYFSLIVGSSFEAWSAMDPMDFNFPDACDWDPDSDDEEAIPPAVPVADPQADNVAVDPDVQRRLD